MKTTIEIPDDVHEAVKREAKQLGKTPTDLIAEVLKLHVAGHMESAPAKSTQRSAMIAALSKGRNSKPIGSLRREELH